MSDRGLRVQAGTSATAPLTAGALPEGGVATAEIGATGEAIPDRIADPEREHPSGRLTAPGGLGRGWLERGCRELFVRSPRGSRVAALDGARAIAVLIVVVYHSWLTRCGLFRHDCAPELTGEPLSVSAVGLLVGHGDLGVDIFFVLSGYLIFSVLHPKLSRADRSVGETVRRFWARRLFRIYPALAVMIPLSMAFFAWLPGTDAAGSLIEGCRTRAWTNYLLINNWPSVGGTVLDFADGAVSCAPWTWSIAIEWQFYLVSPLLVWRYASVQRRLAASGRTPRWWQGSDWACGLLAISLIGRAILTRALGLEAPGLAEPQMLDYLAWLYGNPVARCAPYLIGMAAAAYRLHSDAAAAGTDTEERRDGGVNPWLFRASLTAAAVFLLIGVLPFYPWAGFNLVLASVGRAAFGLAIGLILVAGAAPAPSRYRMVRLLRHRLWYPIAQASYSLYLWQFVGIEAARRFLAALGLTPDQGFWVWTGFAALSLVLGFVFAVWSYLLIERPTRELRPAV